ncbi:MaoC/PaaZ C-terminal domain-containing protein [Fodinicola acaciae]|uniref:MaoC/PaaZ C-terminal domain-containing protein n=1 Tax=Fodinicola acaciae TaxID=2681555 RepID=UPI0013D4ABB4|nr:MaoC/PaaZ C-terminal domain-containing protein [Fodinicola acaciae]
MPDRYTFDEIPQRLGSTFVSPWITVDQRRLELFDEATFYVRDDYEWDVDSFPDGMIEGFHLLALIPYLVSTTARLHDPNAFAMNYGLDRVRFVTPVFVGQKLRARGEVTEIKQKNGGYLILTEFVGEVQGHDRPGFTAALWVLVLPRVPDDLTA